MPRKPMISMHSTDSPTTTIPSRGKMLGRSWRKYWQETAPTHRLRHCSIALRMKGETVEEIVGFAEAIRSAAAPLPVERADAVVAGTGREALAEERYDDSLIDTSGTGGDTSGTFNISTATA